MQIDVFNVSFGSFEIISTTILLLLIVVGKIVTSRYDKTKGADSVEERMREMEEEYERIQNENNDLHDANKLLDTEYLD